MEKTIFKENGITFVLKRSDRARHFRMQIGQDRQLTIVVPKRAMRFQIRRFVSEHQSWIKKQVERLKTEKDLCPPHEYKEGEVFFYFGEKIYLSIEPHKLKRPKVKVAGDQLQVFLFKSVSKSEGVKQVKSAVEGFYKKKAEEAIHDRLQFFNEHYGFKYNRVSLRNQKSRWGSCSRLKNLNFNWRLIMAPIEVIDYVVVHELCHLKQMNHSPKFWKLAEETIPNYKEVRKWLRKNEYLLRV